jgi:ribosomal protein S18 acetylase RimI-like enzyme
MQGKIEITKAVFNDLEEILALQKLAFISEAELYDNYDIEPLQQTIENIRADFETHIFLKAVYNGKIVGSVKGRDTGEYCWIGKLIVHPDFQNQGLGRRLMKEIESLFPNTNQFVLYTGNRSDKNIYLYESLGYEKREVFKDEKMPDVHLIKLIKENKIPDK